MPIFCKIEFKIVIQFWPRRVCFHARGSMCSGECHDVRCLGQTFFQAEVVAAAAVLAYGAGGGKDKPEWAWVFLFFSQSDKARWFNTHKGKIHLSMGEKPSK